MPQSSPNRLGRSRGTLVVTASDRLDCSGDNSNLIDEWFLNLRTAGQLVSRVQIVAHSSSSPLLANSLPDSQNTFSNGLLNHFKRKFNSQILLFSGSKITKRSHSVETRIDKHGPLSKDRLRPDGSTKFLTEGVVPPLRPIGFLKRND